MKSDVIKFKRQIVAYYIQPSEWCALAEVPASSNQVCRGVYSRNLPINHGTSWQLALVAKSTYPKRGFNLLLTKHMK